MKLKHDYMAKTDKVNGFGKDLKSDTEFWKVLSGEWCVLCAVVQVIPVLWVTDNSGKI